MVKFVCFHFGESKKETELVKLSKKLLFQLCFYTFVFERGEAGMFSL